MVASHAEAWIETAYRSLPVTADGVASHAEAWIETPEPPDLLGSARVASHAEAWIETGARNALPRTRRGSPPMRRRGLKLWSTACRAIRCVSPPCGGVDETGGAQGSRRAARPSPPMRRRGLNRLSDAVRLARAVASHAEAWIETAHLCEPLPHGRSPPMRRRGLKRESPRPHCRWRWRRLPLRRRGLKLVDGKPVQVGPSGRLPC